MSAMQRRKGQSGERELSALLAAHLGTVVQRQLGQERDGGADIHIGDYRIQVKRCETLKLDEWWRQTVRDAGYWKPVLAWRQSRKGWRFRVRVEDMLFQPPSNGYTCDMDLETFCYVARERLL